jgi:hypothetical protein
VMGTVTHAAVVLPGMLARTAVPVSHVFHRVVSVDEENLRDVRPLLRNFAAPPAPLSAR